MFRWRGRSSKGGAKATVANRLGVTPLMLAATNGSAAMIDALLKAGANPNDASRRGRDGADDRGAQPATRRPSPCCSKRAPR